MAAEAQLLELRPVASVLLAGLFDFPLAASELRGAGDPAWLFARERELLPRASAPRIAEFAAGRACARDGLARLALPAGEPLLRGAHREPMWPAGALGSITHTEGFCGTVVCRDSQCRGIGIDAERIGRVGEHLWSALFDAGELLELERHGEPARARLATLLFAAKEAFFKSQFALSAAVPEFDAVSVQIRGALAERGELEIAASSDVRLGRFVLPLRGRYAIDGSLAVTGIAIRQGDING